MRLPSLIATSSILILACQTLAVRAAETADAAAPTGLEEVVVTATRRVERLQDVAVSVSVFSQEKLDAQGLRSIDDLTRLTPGVAFSRNGMGSAANYNDANSDINIRGVDSTGGASTTGIYIDDTPIQSRKIGFGTYNAFPALFDLERVEVLRGPQGTLFGAGSEGGTVRFITPEPGMQQNSGYLRSEVSTTRKGDASYEEGAAVGGPIIDDILGFRLSASYRRDGGFVDRVDYRNSQVVESNSNWQETVSVRGALKWQVNESLSVAPSFYYQEQKLNDTAAYWPSLSDPGSAVFRNGNAQTNPSRDPFYLASVKVNWDVGFARLTSSTSFYSRNQKSVSDYTQFNRALYWVFDLLPTYLPPPGSKGSAYFTDTQNNFYQEFRLESADPAARLTWNAGLFYSRLNENSTENITDPALISEIQDFAGFSICPADDVACNTTGLIYYQPYYRVIDKQIAAFGELTFKFTDTLKATVGVRVAKLDTDGQSLYGGPFAGASVQSDQSQSEKPVTPKAVLSWQPDRDNLFYASAAKGYRIGGTNVDIGTICAGDAVAIGLPADANGNRHNPTSYNSDSLWSYELGGKTTLLDRRLQINSSLFLINWKDIQQNVYLPTCGLQFVANLGQVRSRGGDIDIQYRPVDALMLNLTVAYTDAKYTKSTCAGVLTFSDGGCRDSGGAFVGGPIVSEGDRLPGSPWTFLGAAEYTFSAFGGDRKPYLRMDYQYATAQTKLLPGQNPNNGLNDPTIPGLPVTKELALRAGLRWNGIDLSVFGQNLTNSHPILYRSRDIAVPAEQLYFERSIRPRTIGLTGTYRF